MADVVEVLQREIDKRKAEIEALEASLKVLTGSAPKQKAKQLSLPAPEKPAPKVSGEGNFEVNGVDLVLTDGELPIAEALAAAEDCCSVDFLEQLCGGNRQTLHNRIYSLNQKLKAAGAHVVHFKGEGYRLQNIEEAS